MPFLVLAVLSSTINHLLFKAIARFRVNLLCAIVTNYAVCTFIGYISSHDSFSIISVISQTWFPLSIIQGIFLSGCFFLIGKTTEKQGVAVASLATRLSVVIPTIAAFFLYNDAIVMINIIGIAITLLALYLSSVNFKTPIAHHNTFNLLPLILVAVFGTHSTFIKYVQEYFLQNTTYHTYIMFSFMSAFLISGSVLIGKVLKKQQTVGIKDIGLGAILGCANYGSVYFLIKALSIPGWQSSQLFPTISIAVVGFSSLGAWAVFREKFTRRMSTALIVGAISIILVNL